MTPSHHQTADTRDAGLWQRFVGKAKDTWGDLTDNEMMQFEGKYDQAVGYLKQKYGETADAFGDWWDGEKNARS